MFKNLGGSIKIYIVYLYMFGVYVYKFEIILNMWMWSSGVIFFICYSMPDLKSLFDFIISIPNTLYFQIVFISVIFTIL